MPAPRNMGKPHTRAFRGEVGAHKALLELPAAGCSLPVPDMPSDREWSESERARWVELWQSPQACAWDESARGTVALYVAYESALLAGQASAWKAQECRYAGEALGLTPRALASLGWRIVDGGEAGSTLRRDERKADPNPRESMPARRLRAAE